MKRYTDDSNFLRAYRSATHRRPTQRNCAQAALTTLAVTLLLVLVIANATHRT